MYVGVCEGHVARLDYGFVLLHSIFYMLYSKFLFSIFYIYFIYYILYILYSIFHINDCGTLGCVTRAHFSDTMSTGTGKPGCLSVGVHDSWWQ